MGIKTNAKKADLDKLAAITKSAEEINVSIGAGVTNLVVSKLDWLVTASGNEARAEMDRATGASGIFSVRQYTISKPFDPSKKVFDVGYAMLSMHDHPNYMGMCGSGEFSAVVNGLYVRSRHNDYKLASMPTNPKYLELVSNNPPPVPASILSKPTGVTSTGVVDIVNDTQAKAMYNIVTDYKSSCRWEMSYMEVWLEEYQSTLDDPFSSFRHSIDAASIEEALSKAIYLNQSGHKNRLENIPFLPSLIRTVDANGLPIIGTVKYRVITKDVSDGVGVQYNQALATAGTLNTSNSFVLTRDLKTKKGSGYTTWDKLAESRSAKFRMDPVKLNALIETIPGMDGPGAVLSDEYLMYGLTDSLNKYGSATEPLNAAYYHRQYTVVKGDASGRSNAFRGFNDPNLYVAKTTQPKVIGGFTYMIPLEMILRTPLESWNPHNIPVGVYNTLVTSAAAGGGSTAAKPLAGYNDNLYNTKIPFLLFGDPINGDLADTGTANNFVTAGDGTVVKVTASGIRSFNLKNERIRFPIAPNYHEFTKAWSDLEVFKTEVTDILKGIVGGSITTAAGITDRL